MAALVLTDAEILAGPLRMGGVANELSMELKAAALDATVFTSGGWRTMVGGLKEATVDVQGFYNTDVLELGAVVPDNQLFTELGGTQLPLTISPTGVDGSLAYIVPVKRGTLQMLGKVGELAPFGSTMWGDGQVARGALIHPATVLRTTTGTGSGVVLGTVPTGKNLVVSMHVLAVTGTGPALTLTVQRDDNVGFTTPTTVATLGPVSAPQASLTVVAGPITPDDRYRVIWTLTGTTPSARFAAAVGTTN